MSDRPDPGVGDQRPRLPPRPLWRPPVDPAQAAGFARPATITPPPRLPATGITVPEVPAVTADAFASGSGTKTGLERPPTPPPVDPGPPAPGDPWRDTGGVVSLVDPAAAPQEPDAGPPSQQDRPLPRFTMREALFQRRIRPGTLLVLLVVCLLVGAIGAAGGLLLANRLPAASSSPRFQLAPVTSAASAQPGSVADIAARILPSVVSIQVLSGDTGDSGSGFVIDASGDILTNNHVISAAATDSSATLTVLFDGDPTTRLPARVVGRDTGSDLAVIRVDASNLTVAQLGDSDQVRLGDPVVAVGSPLGLDGTVTTGIVSAKDRAVRLQGEGTDTDAVVSALQTDAAVNPGNSGGPLVDARGAVIGINTAIRTLGGDQSGSIGIGFAIPINVARAVAQTLINGQKVVHAGMGVSTSTVSDGSQSGALVQDVSPGGPAAAAGIAEGDVVVKVGDHPVLDADTFVVAVQSYTPGAAVPVALIRSGRTMTVTVTLSG